MILAKNKRGQIGRMVPGTGFQARVDTAQMGERRGSVFVNARSIEEDEAYYGEKERQARAVGEAKRLQSIVQKNAALIARQKQAESTEAFQRLGRLNPMNEKLKKHFARQKGMGESVLVADSLLRNPADFSSSGGNPEIVPSSQSKRPIAWNADFRQHLIVGNPLTRDGEYGPAVTDYDRYIKGDDVNQTNVVQIAGGTMLGRYNGGTAPSGSGMQAMSGNPRTYSANMRRGIPNGLGEFSFPSWDSITTGLSTGLNTGVTNLATTAPTSLLNNLIKGITGGGGSAQVTSPGNITVYQPGTGAVKTMSQTIGLPTWAIYSGLGLIGIGTLFMVIKAVKK